MGKEDLTGKIVKLFSGAKIKITGKCYDENSDMFDWEGVDDNNEKCWCRDIAISATNCTSMKREPRV